jgi:hypothetical protein
MFVILQEQEGRQHWMRAVNAYSTSMMAVHDDTPPASLQYPDRETSERDAEIFRAKNAREVEATKRRRKYKTAPATYSVVEVLAELED